MKTQPTRDFAEILDWHLTNATRPDGKHIHWTNKSFAAAYRLKINDKTIRNWRRGRNLPTALDNIEQALFGDNETPQYLAWREELRAAYAISLRKRSQSVPEEDFAPPSTLPDDIKKATNTSKLDNIYCAAPTTNLSDSKINDFIPFNTIATSPLYEDCKTLILYLYINESKAYEYSNAYEHTCLRSTRTGQYFGFEYTPYAIEVTSEESTPKRNQPHFRNERLKWLNVAELLVKHGILTAEARDSDPRARDERRVFALSDQGKVLAAEAVRWMKDQHPEKVPRQSPFILR